jgi:hypothetical protein
MGTRITLLAAAVFMLLVASAPDTFWTAGLTTGFVLLLFAGVLSLGEAKSKLSGPVAGCAVAIILLTGLATAYADQIRIVAVAMVIAALAWLGIWLLRRHRQRATRPRPT